MLGTLLMCLALPRYGSVAHAAVWVASCFFDQTRMQPQSLCFVVMFLALAFRDVRWFARWFLAALWFWAGMHKLFSPDWYGEQSWRLAAQLHLDPASMHHAVALAVAVYEILLGVLAATRPHWAIVMCVPMHVGIAVILSPLMASWNHTVMPWNIATAVAGAWLLWQVRPGWPQSARQLTVAVVLLTMPAGFYVGWIDHHFAFVLYSDNVPRGLVTTRDGCWEIESWEELGSAFPNERRLLYQYFGKVAQPGWKLHIADPRWWLGDLYYVKSENSGVQRITRDEFAEKQNGAVDGIAYDNRRSLFKLSVAGARLLKRDTKEMIYAAEIKPDIYRAELLHLLAGLPNLEQIQLRNCPIRDEDLKYLPRLSKLVGIGLEGTHVTDAAIKVLRLQPKLQFIEAAHTQISAAALAEAGFN